MDCRRPPRRFASWNNTPNANNAGTIGHTPCAAAKHNDVKTTAAQRRRKAPSNALNMI